MFIYDQSSNVAPEDVSVSSSGRVLLTHHLYQCDLLYMYVHHIQSFYILLFKYIYTYISGLVIRRQGGLIHVAPVVCLLGEQHGGEREGSGCYQGVVYPGVANAEDNCCQTRES